MLEQGNYGVEWTVRPSRNEGPSLLGRIVFVVILVSLVSFTWTLVKRFKADREETLSEERYEAEKPTLPAATERTEGSPVVEEPQIEVPPPPPPPEVSRLGQRPPKVRNLLMRLEEAEKIRDVEMAITTIEALRTLPGSPAADLDDALARRLGVLNVRRLYTLKSAQWVDTVQVKRGDSASRIASEHGSTLASLSKLNEGKIDRLRIGEKVYVLNHPRFNLVVRRRSKTADLQLNGKFFKRYDLLDDSGLKDGAFEWREISLKLKPADRSELDVLLPRSTSVLVSEL